MDSLGRFEEATRDLGKDLGTMISHARTKRKAVLTQRDQLEAMTRHHALNESQAQQCTRDNALAFLRTLQMDLDLQKDAHSLMELARSELAQCTHSLEAKDAMSARRHWRRIKEVADAMDKPRFASVSELREYLCAFQAVDDTHITPDDLSHVLKTT